MLTLRTLPILQFIYTIAKAYVNSSIKEGILVFMVYCPQSQKRFIIKQKIMEKCTFLPKK